MDSKGNGIFGLEIIDKAKRKEAAWVSRASSRLLVLSRPPWDKAIFCSQVRQEPTLMAVPFSSLLPPGEID
jgi:hypothetical protein